MRKPCIFCEGGGCSDCAAREGGDQGSSPLEIEVLRLRDEVRVARAEKLSAEVAAAEAQRSTAEMKTQLDAALTQLALLSEARA